MIEKLRKHKLAFGSALLLILLALIVLSLARSSRQERVLGKIKKGTITEAVYGVGTVTAKNIFQLKVGVTSSIRSLHVREGDRIKAGAPLVYLEGTTLFRAPFTGTVTSLPYQEGETVFPQTPVMTLTDLENRYIVVSLQQQAVVRVEKGQQAKISFESMRDQTFYGKVRTIYSNNGQFLVNIDVTTLSPRILPGMTADVAIAIQKKENVLLAPVNAISSGKILIKKGGRSHEIPVQVGVVDSEVAEIIPTEVSSEISEGDLVVLKGR